LGIKIEEKEWWELARNIIIEDSFDPTDLVKAIQSLEKKTKSIKGNLRPIYENVLVLFKKFLDCGKLLKKGDYNKSRTVILSSELLKKVNIYYKQMNKQNLIKEANTLILVFNFHRASIGFDKGYFVPKKYHTKDDLDLLYGEYNIIFDLFKNIVQDVIDIKEFQFLRYFWELFTNALSTLCDSYLELQDRLNSVEVFNGALKFLNSIDEESLEEWKQEKIMDIYMRIGDLFFLKLDEYKEAEKYYKIAKKLNKNVKADNYTLFLSERDAGLALINGNEDQALIILNKISRLIRELDITGVSFDSLEINCFQNIALMYYKMDKYEDANSFFKIALTRIDKFDIKIPKQVLKMIDFRIAYAYNLINSRAELEAFKPVTESYELVKKLPPTKKSDYQLVDILGLLLHLLKFSGEEKTKNKYQEELEKIINKQEESETLPPGKLLNALNFNTTFYIERALIDKSLENANRALSLFNSLPENMKNNSTYQDILADVYSNFGRIFSFQNQNREAIAYYTRSLEIYEPLLAERSQYYNQFTSTLHSLAKLYHRIGNHNSAKILLGFCKEIRNLLYDTNKAAYGVMLGNTLNDKGLLHLTLGEIDEAKEDLTAAFNIYENLNNELLKNQDARNSNFEDYITIYSNTFAMILNNLGKLYEKLKISKESGFYYQRAVNIRSNLHKSNPEQFELPYVSSLNNLAALNFDYNKLAESEKLWLKAQKIIKESPNKHKSINQIFHAKILNNIFRLYFEKKVYTKALKSLEDAYLIVKDNSHIEAIIEKTTSLFFYENLITKSPSTQSKIINLKSHDRIPSIRKLISIDDHFVKVRIENLYLSLFKNEISGLFKKKNCKWSDLERILKIIQSLRSSKSVINQDENNQDEEESKVLDLDLESLISKLKDLKQKRRETKEKISYLDSKRSQLTRESFYSQKSSLYRQDMGFTENASQLYRDIQKLSLSEIQSIRLISDSLEAYLNKHPNHSFLILQHVFDQMVFIYLTKKERIVKGIPANPFLKIGSKLFNQINTISEGVIETNSKDIVKSIGVELFKKIPVEIRNKLFQNESIQISSCGKTIDIPMEYIHNEKNFLGLEVIISKIFSLNHYIAEVNSLNKRNIDSFSALVITDPKTDRYEKLTYAIKECDILIDNLKKSKFDIKHLQHEEARLSNIEPILDMGLSLLHFSGHGEENGLVLLYDEVLDSSFLRERFIWFVNRPIIFLNCCLTGITPYFGGGKFEGLVPNLHRANSGPIVASNKKVFDDNSKEFSVVFYNELLDGKSIGKAFQNAQKHIEDSLLWGTFQLFGYPEHSIK